MSWEYLIQRIARFVELQRVLCQRVLPSIEETRRVYVAFEDHTDRDHLPEFRFQERRIWQQADMEEMSSMNEYKPPFHMTDKTTNLVGDISEQIGRIKVLSHGNLNPALAQGVIEMTIPDKPNS